MYRRNNCPSCTKHKKQTKFHFIEGLVKIYPAGTANFDRRTKMTWSDTVNFDREGKNRKRAVNLGFLH